MRKGKNPFAPPERRAQRCEAPAENSPAREGGVERGTEWRSAGPAQTSCAAPSALVSIAYTPRPHGSLCPTLETEGVVDLDLDLDVDLDVDVLIIDTFSRAS